ncbi:MAG: hypothetical protein OXI60_07020 [Acidiferrobacterales bacterium]|nr:hypothetical protein [Acidiferrobacterales bacterium]
MKTQADSRTPRSDILPHCRFSSLSGHYADVDRKVTNCTNTRLSRISSLTVNPQSTPH